MKRCISLFVAVVLFSATCVAQDKPGSTSPKAHHNAKQAKADPAKAESTEATIVENTSGEVSRDEATEKAAEIKQDDRANKVSVARFAARGQEGWKSLVFYKLAGARTHIAEDKDVLVRKIAQLKQGKLDVAGLAKLRALEEELEYVKARALAAQRRVEERKLEKDAAEDAADEY